MKRSLSLRMLLAAIKAASWLAPPSRRREWQRQWHADIRHEWNWLERHPRGVAGPASLAGRTAGALQHAFWLRRIERITHDLRYGWRQMLRRPGISAVAILTLGLGIGANVTMYSWLDGRLRGLLTGVDHPDRIVAFNGTSRTRNDLSTSYPDFQDYRQRRPDTIDDLVAFSLVPMNMRTSGDPLRVFGEIVSGNYFDMLGVRAALGRTFRPDEVTVTNRDPVVVLSHNFWQRRFGGNTAIVGQTVTLNGRAFTIVGVTTEGFHGTEPYLNIDLWVPMSMQPAVMSGGDRLNSRGQLWLEVFVRLKPGVPLARAEADLGLVARDLAVAYPDAPGSGVKLYELWRAPTMGGMAVTAVMGVQLGVAGIVLLIACANVANLLLASAATRQRETAVRLTLGASRSRLVQQLLTESTLLAVAGGLAGVAFAYATRDVVRLFIPPAPLPIMVNSTLNGAAFIFAAVVTIATALIFGLVPAWQGSTTSIVTSLKESATSITSTRRRARLRQGLVIAQVALSLVLLVSAGLFLRTLLNAQSVDPGFATRRGLLAAIDLLPAGYDASRGRVFQQQLLSEVRAIPGVEAASFVDRVPLGFGGQSAIRISVDGYSPAPNEEMLVYWNRVGSDYLRTMGIRLVEGREFTDRDTDTRPDVVLVNETMARRYFGGRSPIGGRIRIAQRTLEVVGVAGDGKYTSITESPRAVMFAPGAQWYRPDVVLTLKTASDPGAVVAALQAAVRHLDANIPLFDMRTIADHLEISVFVQRMVASLLGVFGMLAILLATVGLYGVIAALAAQRTPEIGMRMALGARAVDIVTMILKQASGMIGLGVVAGLIMAFAVTRLFKSLLVGVAATDAVSFGATTVLLLAVGLAASYLPARRAASISPLTALRNE
jgi:macrolide transport system ATP-binding/permease protein